MFYNIYSLYKKKKKSRERLNKTSVSRLYVGNTRWTNKVRNVFTIHTISNTTPVYIYMCEIGVAATMESLNRAYRMVFFMYLFILFIIYKHV